MPNMKIDKKFSYFKQKLFQKFLPVLSCPFGLLHLKGECYRHDFFVYVLSALTVITINLRL